MFRFQKLQSTSLLRGKTSQPKGKIISSRLQSTSLLRGKTLYRLTFLLSKVLQSTSLLRGKTMDRIIFGSRRFASIHFPLAREDIFDFSTHTALICFNPLPSCEGRPISSSCFSSDSFASIHFPLARGDTKKLLGTGDIYASIHFPLAREDDSLVGNSTIFDCFNPLPSCEGRLIRHDKAFEHILLQSTSLLRGKTRTFLSQG